MNATGTQHLAAARLQLQDAAERIAQSAREGEPNITDRHLLERMLADVKFQIRIIDARLG